MVEVEHDLTNNSYPLWTVNNNLIRQLVQRTCGQGGFDADGRHVPDGIVSPKGPAGSMILFHSCSGTCI